MKLWAKLLLFLVPLAAGSLVLMTLGTRRTVTTVLLDSVETQGRSLARSFPGPAAVEGLRRRSETVLLPRLQALLAGGASYAAALEPGGRVISHTDVTEVGRVWSGPGIAEAMTGGPPVSRRVERRGKAYLEVLWAVPGPLAKGEDLLLESGQAPPVGLVVVGVPLAEPLATARRITLSVFIVVCAVSFAGMALMVFFLRVVLRPVGLLAEAARKLAAGQIGAVVPVVSHDEVGRLAQTFNEMSRSLAKTTVTQEFLRSVLDSMLDGVVVSDPEGRVRMVNPSALAVLGGSAADWHGRPVTALFSDKPPVPLGGSAHSFETDLAGPVGRKVPVLCGVSGLPGQRPGSLVLTFRDITGRKAAEEELARSNLELEQFAFIASHDLQEPLRKVSSYCQLLQKRYAGKLDPDADDFIRFAVEGAARMRQLIGDLLAYSRVGRVDADWGKADLGKALDRALQNLGGALEATGGKVRRSGPLPAVPGSLVQLTQLFQNLLGNALKFRGAGPAVVEVGAVKREGLWEVFVKDNGIGIEARHQDKIFAMFQRLHAQKDYPGSGIGLAICRKIVERHGGRIWVESEPGKGSVFRFTLRSGEV